MNKSAFQLTGHSLRVNPQGAIISRVLAAALSAVEPGEAVSRFMRRDGHKLSLGEREYDLKRYRRVLLIGFGKAALPMGQKATQILGEYFSSGVLVTKRGYALQPGESEIPGLTVLEAAHPVPDESCVSATARLLELVAGATGQDLVICLVSGGGSALLTQPVEPLSLADIQTTTRVLLGCGASIHEINTLRKHLDRVKGGGLARYVAPAELVTLILSDVIGDPMDLIASGPTVADPACFKDALNVLEQYAISQQVPAAVLQYLQQGAAGNHPETLKVGDVLLQRVYNLLVGSNRQAGRAAVEQARREGLSADLLTSALQGEASQAGRFLAALAGGLVNHEGDMQLPACWVLGGETTVTLHNLNGRGGRNQEMALAAVSDLAGLPGVYVVTLATDGGDGPTDAAGAVVTGDSLQRALDKNLSPVSALQQNDSYPFFAALDDLLLPGPTRTNVNDLAFVFVFPD
ncbi:MAG: glycerate kinase [Anaerolineae bacterium]|nr:glycerate kinase [Anaerolineae bacterium]